MKNACYYCRYWIDKKAKSGDGECRRFPKNVQGGYTDRWPTTAPSEWCGEFKRKEKKNEAE